MVLSTPNGGELTFDILDVFPFTSESKRMGIVVRDTQNGEITFMQKGADVTSAQLSPAGYESSDFILVISFPILVSRILSSKDGRDRVVIIFVSYFIIHCLVSHLPPKSSNL